MTQELKSLVKAIASSQNELQLQENVMVHLGEYFMAKRYRLFLVDRLPKAIHQSLLFKSALSPNYNPVLKYVVENHIPVHEGVLLTARKWHAICPRFDHGHVMVGPVVKNGNLIGGLAFTRDRLASSFDRQNLLDLSALCLHVSTQLVTIQSRVKQLDRDSHRQITSRELQIARLVAQGLTNKEIGKVLWITENSVKQALKRMFRKLKVSSRAEMVALLAKD